MTEPTFRDLAQRAGRIGAVAELEAVELMELHSRRTDQRRPPSDGGNEVAIELNVEIEPVETPPAQGGRFVLVVSYQLTGTLNHPSTDESTEVLSVQSKWLLNYAIPLDFAPSTDALHAYATVSGLFALHPYVRAFMQDLSTRMGLPPLVLPVLRSPLDRIAAGQQAETISAD